MNLVNRISNTFTKALFLMLLFCALISKNSHASISSIIVDASSGEVISSSNADELRYPASLTKIMTLYITFDALDKGLIKMDNKLKVSRKAANRAPSRLGLKIGETITVETAVMALIVKSANDCATVLAEGLGYSEENFAETMTRVAKELGMKNTTFKNASGLPNSAQKTTARDMAILGAAMYHHFPQYYPLFSTRTFTFNGYTHYTHNKFLRNFNGADGLKTGFTNAAGYNIITSAEQNGQRVIAVTMGHRSAKGRDSHVAKMMNNGLSKLFLAAKTKGANIYAALDEKSSSNESSKTYAMNTSYHIEENEEDINENPSSWGIQIGAFSNYSKARNYALEIKKEINKLYKDITVDIEAIQKNAAVIYRSKIIGFEKNTAENACIDLINSNKSCIVVAVDEKNELTLAHYKDHDNK